MAAQSNSEEHVYDSIDNYEANPTAVENQQIAPPSSESRVADTPFSDQLTCDGAQLSNIMRNRLYQHANKKRKPSPMQQRFHLTVTILLML